MKTFITAIIAFFPFLVFAQRETKYYDSGQLKSEWKSNPAAGIVSSYFYFETGELKSIGIFDTLGVLQNYYHFNQRGDTLGKSHIPEFKRQPKKNLTDIKWSYTSSGIGYFFESKAIGNKIQAGEEIKVWYVGYFEDGGQFDNSDITGRLLEVKIGEGKLLRSFEEGLMLFKKGQKGYIKIPSSLGYGDKPAGNIPPDSTLIYHIEIK